MSESRLTKVADRTSCKILGKKTKQKRFNKRLNENAQGNVHLLKHLGKKYNNVPPAVLQAVKTEYQDDSSFNEDFNMQTNSNVFSPTRIPDQCNVSFQAAKTDAPKRTLQFPMACFSKASETVELDGHEGFLLSTRLDESMSRSLSLPKELPEERYDECLADTETAATDVRNDCFLDLNKQTKRKVWTPEEYYDNGLACSKATKTYNQNNFSDQDLNNQAYRTTYIPTQLPEKYGRNDLEVPQTPNVYLRKVFLEEDINKNNGRKNTLEAPWGKQSIRNVYLLAETNGRKWKDPEGCGFFRETQWKSERKVAIFSQRGIGDVLQATIRRRLQNF